jgi:TIR domain
MTSAIDQTSGPSVFISYAHEDSGVAHRLAEDLKKARLKVWVDEGELLVGDSIIQKVSEAISEVDFLVALVSEASVASNWCQKELSLAITRGIGNARVTVLPLRLGTVVMPASLRDTYYLTVDPNNAADLVDRLVRDIYRHMDTQPVKRQANPDVYGAVEQRARGLVIENEPDADPIRILGVDDAGVGRPLNDGSRGSALYAVPLRLSRTPSRLWAELFVETWNHPPRFTTMHRPGIASVQGDRIVLDGTTMDELERYHMDTLKVVMADVNERVRVYEEQEQLRTRREAESAAEHQRLVKEAAGRLKFD